MKKNICDIPRMGVGLGYRTQIGKEIREHAANIDCVEIITENYIFNANRFSRLKKISENFKVIPHGINLSIASPFVDMAHLSHIKSVCDLLNAPYYSEHLCLTKTATIGLGHLTPIVFNEKVLALLVKNICLVQEFIQRPLVLENITYYFDFKNSTLEVTDFLNKLVDATGCGLLLDLENLYINSQNLQFDPYCFIDDLPHNHVIQVHLAGGYQNVHGKYIDSHSREVAEPTWRLLEYLCKQASVKAIILEHDTDFPEDFSVLLNQLTKARNIMNGATCES